MVPALLVRAHVHGAMLLDAHGRLWPPFTVLTSMFIHGGVGHVAGNMLYLFIFGPAVEERTGPAHYLSFYLLSGIASAAATVAMAPQSMVPVIGASGAIAGVLGAYFILYPRGSILTFFPPFFFRVPAVLYLIVWFAAQLYSGIASGAARLVDGRCGLVGARRRLFVRRRGGTDRGASAGAPARRAALVFLRSTSSHC